MSFHAVIVLLVTVTCIADFSDAITFDQCYFPKMISTFNSSVFGGRWYVHRVSKDDNLASNKCMKMTNIVKSPTVIDTVFEATTICGEVHSSINVTVTQASDSSPVLYVDDGNHPQDGYERIVIGVIDTNYYEYLICIVCNTDNPSACDEGSTTGSCEMENRVIVMSKLPVISEGAKAKLKTILKNANVTDELAVLKTINQRNCL